MAAKQRLTVGIDLGDKTSRYCILDEAGEVVSEGASTHDQGGDRFLIGQDAGQPNRAGGGDAFTVGEPALGGLGHEVIVANAHKVKLITQSVRKNDRIDARQLARLARVDPKLLSPIRHRGEQAQRDLAVIRARAELMESANQADQQRAGTGETDGGTAEAV